MKEVHVEDRWILSRQECRIATMSVQITPLPANPDEEGILPDLVEAPGIAWGTRLAERYRRIRWARQTTDHDMSDITTDSPKLKKVA